MMFSSVYWKQCNVKANFIQRTKQKPVAKYKTSEFCDMIKQKYRHN